jgi:ubiquinone/menaquinone biosynthesis C-methylase UbiE
MTGDARQAVERVLASPDRVRMWLLRQPFFTSTVLPAIPRPLRWALRKAYFAPVDLADRVLRRRTGELVPPRSAIFAGSVDGYRASGRRLVRMLEETAALAPSSRVLDVGSGNGRLAVALTETLGEQGSYDGLDIVASGIEWCSGTITPRYPSFRFTHADVFNAEYNPRGSVRPGDYRFPYPDESFDLVVLVSVFTHMLPADMDHYLAEIARVLAPGGRCFATYFLLNEESERLMEAGSSSLRFKHELGACRVVNPAVPELSVAYAEAVVRETHERNGLTLDEGFRYGGWCGRPPLWGDESGPGDQDVVVSMRR